MVDKAAYPQPLIWWGIYVITDMIDDACTEYCKKYMNDVCIQTVLDWMEMGNDAMKISTIVGSAVWNSIPERNRNLLFRIIFHDLNHAYPLSSFL
jgi:hypothetical protein